MRILLQYSQPIVAMTLNLAKRLEFELGEVTVKYKRIF